MTVFDYMFLVMVSSLPFVLFAIYKKYWNQLLIAQMVFSSSFFQFYIRRTTWVVYLEEYMLRDSNYRFRFLIPLLLDLIPFDKVLTLLVFNVVMWFFALCLLDQFIKFLGFKSLERLLGICLVTTTWAFTVEGFFKIDSLNMIFVLSIFFIIFKEDKQKRLLLLIPIIIFAVLNNFPCLIGEFALKFDTKTRAFIGLVVTMGIPFIISVIGFFQPCQYRKKMVLMIIPYLLVSLISVDYFRWYILASPITVPYFLKGLRVIINETNTV